MASIPLADKLSEIEQAIGSVLLGQSRAIRLLLAAVASGGHVLIEDRPGVGKTTLVRALAGCLGLEMQRIQGTSDLLPSDLTGVHVFDPTSTDWTFRPGPLLAPVVMVDELNRATPKAQSALLEAMEEGQVTVGGETVELPTPHIVLATQNPIGEAGTYPLGAAQLDRFAVVISLGMANREAERNMLERGRHPGAASVARPVLSGEELIELRGAVNETSAASSVVDFLLDIVDAVRGSDDSIWLSSRVPLDLLATARGLAFLDGRSFVSPDDVKAAARATFLHRLPRFVDQQQLDAAIQSIAVPVNGARR